MIIRPANDNDVKSIHQLANQTWWTTYHNINTDEQIGFMLKQMYSEESLKHQIIEGERFLIAQRNNNPVGFAGYSYTDQQEKILKIKKLYILPSEQGKGVGKKLIEYLTALCKVEGATILQLNVNRSNPAVEFYKKLGFEIYKSVDLPYYQYELNDYVMRKTLI